MNPLFLIGRNKELFKEDISNYDKELSKAVSSTRFLVVGGADSANPKIIPFIHKLYYSW